MKILPVAILLLQISIFTGCGGDENAENSDNSSNETMRPVEQEVQSKEICIVNNRGKDVVYFNRLDDSHVIQLVTNSGGGDAFAEMDVYVINTETCKVSSLGKAKAKSYSVFGYGRCVYNVRTANGEPIGEMVIVTKDKIVETGVQGIPLSISAKGVFYEDPSSHINLLKNNGKIVSLGRDSLHGKSFIIAGFDDSKVYFTNTSYSGIFSQSVDGGPLVKIAESSLSRSSNGALGGTNPVHSPVGPIIITRQQGGLAILDGGNVNWITTIPGLNSDRDYKRIARDSESLYIAMRGKDDKSKYTIYRWSGGKLNDPVVLFNSENQSIDIHAVVPDGVLVSGESRELWIFKHDGTYEVVLTREEFGGGTVVSADSDKTVIRKYTSDGDVLVVFQR